MFIKNGFQGFFVRRRTKTVNISFPGQRVSYDADTAGRESGVMMMQVMPEG